MASFMIIAVTAVISLPLFCPLNAQGQGLIDITDQVKQEIFDREIEWNEFYNSGNFTGLCDELYTDDCVINLPGLTKARGREGCARGWEAIKAEDYQFAAVQTPMIKEVIVTSSGDVIEHSITKDTVDQYIKYMQIWRRIEGKLYIFHELDSMNTPYKEPTLLEEITDRVNEMSYYFNTGNFRSMCNRYTPDCWIGQAGTPPVSGRDGCEILMVKNAVAGVATIIQMPDQYEVIDLGDGYILSHSAVIIYDEAGVELDREKDMDIWKRMPDGQVYLHFDMWNSDVHF